MRRVHKLIASIHRLFTFRMTARRYLLYLTLGSIAVNGVLNAGFAWLKRSMEMVPLWSRAGIAYDTLQTTLMLSALTVIFGTVSIRHDKKVGRFEMMTWTPKRHPVLNLFPYPTVLRAIAFGPIFTLVLVPPTLAVFVLAGVHAMPFWSFFAFKIVYAVILGMVVTPLNAIWVLTEPDRSPTSEMLESR